MEEFDDFDLEAEIAHEEQFNAEQEFGMEQEAMTEAELFGESASSHGVTNASEEQYYAGLANADFSDVVSHVSTNGESSFVAQNAPHVRNMPGFDASILGYNILSRPPVFDHSRSESSGWVHYRAAGMDGIVPKRAMCINVPIECFSRDAHRISHWQTPLNNPTRAASIAALLSLLWTGTAKGFLSGNHVEIARDAGNEGTDSSSREKKKKKAPDSVRSYQYLTSDNREQPLPMFVMCYEELYNEAKTEVLAIRIWKLVFDGNHSDSELLRQLIDENADRALHSGVAHCPNSQRKQTLTQEHKRTAALTGGPSLASAKLEWSAGMQYTRVTRDRDYMNLLDSYAGRTDTSPGRPVVLNMSSLGNVTNGMLNRPIDKDIDGVLGGTHPLAPEWLFNAMRTEGLTAGLVDFDGKLMAVHPDHMVVSKYFESDSHVMRLPEWMKVKKNFYFMTHPAKDTPFDLPLPRPLAGNVTPGPELLGLFRERFAKDRNLDENELLDLFNNVMTGTDQWTEKQLKSWSESISTYDTMDCSDEERIQKGIAQNIMSGSSGLRSYGMMDGESTVIEPRQVLKEIARESNQVHAKVISPWIQDQRKALDAEEERLRAADDGVHADTDVSHAHFEELREKKKAFNERRNKLMKELAFLHMARTERSFNSRMDAETIPKGYKAVWNGLHKELRDMPNGSANIAFGLGIQMTDSDRTVFGHTINWIGSFFEGDCFIDGRDWRIMQELLLHCFEQFGEQTLLLIFCGPKGNGKSLRTERAMAAFPEDWITLSGPSSAKSGMQGNSESSNGCNCVYDEMIDDLVGGDGDNRTEYWKQILMKREFVYNKVITIKGGEGKSDQMKTFKLRTPHQETHCVCTNRGPAFTKGKEEPSEVKSALIDRAVVQFVRTLGEVTRSDAEFREHLSKPETKSKLRAFRIFVCLVALVKMFIYRQPYFQPDLAMAQKMFDEWDNGRQGLCRAFGLPKPSPRKNIKRLENLVTLTCMNAVAQVFFFKQSAYKYESAELDANGMPKKFDMRMLWDVLQILQPTPEIIHHAWTMGLEYSIGTSSMGLNSMTILAETFLAPIGSMLREAPFIDKNLEEYCENPATLRALDAEHKNAQSEDQNTFTKANDRRQGAFGGYSQGAQSMQANSMYGKKLMTEFQPLLFDSDSYISDNKAQTLANSLRRRRETRCEFMYRNTRSALGSVVIANPEKHVETVMDPSPTYAGLEDDANLPGEERGRRMFLRAEMLPKTLTDRAIFMGFHRERARKFPGPLFCGLDHRKPESKKWCPYCMYEEKVPKDPEAAMKVNVPICPEGKRPYIGPNASASWPDLLEAALHYKPQTLANWACGGVAQIEPPGLSRLGTRPEVQYSTWGNGTGGEKRYNTAWLQLHENGIDTWFNFSNFVRHHAKNRTMAQFDIHLDGLKDCFYLMSTRDNARPIREEPLVRGKFKNAIEDSSGKTDFVEADTFVVKPKYPWLPDASARMDHKTFSRFQMCARDPSALIPDTLFQRSFDLLVYGNCLQPLSCYYSSNVSNTAPVRLFNNLIQASNSSLSDHIALVTESSLRCSMVPGLKNRQEKFCHSQTGPDGFGVAPSSSRKREKDVPIAEIEGNRILPYSYDLIQMCLSLYMSERIYDDMSEEQLVSTTLHHGQQLGFDTKFEDLPQLTFKFLGYDEENRQTISVPLPSKRDERNDYVEAGDPSFQESNVSVDHVSRALGREATTRDVERYIQSRQGSRSMRGVSGDLFAQSTWFNHSLATLEDRGLIRGSPDETAVSALANMQSCISARIVELASQKGLGDFGKLKITVATPRTYGALDKRAKESAQVVNVESKRKRQIGKSTLCANTANIILTPGIMAPTQSAPNSRSSSRSHLSAAVAGCSEDIIVPIGGMEDVRANLRPK